MPERAETSESIGLNRSRLRSTRPVPPATIHEHPACFARRLLLQSSSFGNKTNVEQKQQQICGFGCCPIQNWYFCSQDTVRGTPKSGVPENVPVRAYQ